MKRKIDAVFIGPPKSASTWLYYCFKEHPQIFVPEVDFTNYYNIDYNLDKDKHDNLYKDAKKNQIIVEMDPSYLSSIKAAKRIYQDNHNAKIIMCLRNPIDRAFSHYWHFKKKGVIKYSFSDVLKHYDLFKIFIEPGFYADHLKAYFDIFPKEQILVTFYEDIKKDPEIFIQKIFSFLKVDKKFKPLVLHKKINTSGYKRNFFLNILLKIGAFLKNRDYGIYLKIKENKIDQFFKNLISNNKEYRKGIEPELKNTLIKIYNPEIERLEKILKINLSNWKTN